MKALGIVICICLLASLHVGAQEARYAPKQLIVSFENKENAVLETQNGRITCIFSTVMSILESYNATSMRRLYSGDKGAQNIYLIELGNDTDVDLAIAELRNNPEIRSATRNYAIEFLTEPTDWYYNGDYFPKDDPDGTEDQWYLKVMQANKAWDVERGKPEITIAILDQGIDFFHQDLEDNIWVNPGEDLDSDGVVWDVDDLNGVDDDGNGYIDDLVGWDFKTNSIGDNYPYPAPYYEQHGTMMASVGAVTSTEQPGDTSLAGISWFCKLVPLKVDFYNGVAEALNYAATMGIDIANMSFHLPDIQPEDKETLHEAITAAKNAGVVLVAAVNKESPTKVTYPHGFEEVIAVTVVDEYGVLTWGPGPNDEKYGYHSGVDVCGLGILVTNWRKSFAICTYGDQYTERYPGSQSPHVYWWHRMSTSYACAQVSAVAGLLRSVYPDSSVDFIKQEIQRGAIPVDTVPGNESFQGMLGAGRINPYRSLTQWGRIRNDTTWAKFAYVSADLKIDEGKTLTIEPGTIIYFAPDDNDNQYDPTTLEFRVYGTLIAEGTAANPIEFRSLAENPQPGDWSGIQVFGNAASASLAYCNISDAYHGIKSYRPVQLSHCNISNCEVYGVYLEGSGANGSEITYCGIGGNGGDGILVNSSNNITIDHCESSENYDGIWLTYSSNCTIENTLMDLNSDNGIKANNSSCTFVGCTVQNNGQQGIYLNYTGGSITYTKIWKNTANGLYCVGSSSSPEVEYSKIEQNAVGVRVASNGCPILGNSTSGAGQHNSIYNQPMFVYGSPYYTIMAENCWWGAGPGEMPSPKKFKGLVDFNPMLESDPVPNLASMAPKMPPVLSLAQNFPNPSFGTGTTNIMYSIPMKHEGQRMNLTIYDVNGRKVRTLAEGAKTAGSYQTYWDGRGEKGQNMAPGIYFYKLTVGTSSIAKKLILVR